MLIRVKYVDDRFDMVSPDVLDRLLEAGKVREFQRHEGWVMPGVTPTRCTDRAGVYTGHERRHARKILGESSGISPRRGDALILSEG